MAGKTLYDKLWDAHVVHGGNDGNCLIYIDRHLVHEVTSPQAFDGLDVAGRTPWRVDANIAVADHNIPTTGRARGITDPISRLQVDTLDENCARYGITKFNLDDIRQGIVHIIGPEQGLTLPGMTIVCGDSHTSTHGALATLAFGIGTSEVEQVLATQCLWQKKTKNMRIRIDGELPPGVAPKDVILAIIGHIGSARGSGYTIEYAGDAIRGMSIEGRMSLCNMTIEAGARAGMVACDDKTVEYLRGRPFAPKGEIWEQAVAAWGSLVSDPDAHFDKEIEFDASQFEPFVTWGTSPDMTAPISGSVPDPESAEDPTRKEGYRRALEYMDLLPGTPISDIKLDKIFIGSCTNSRIEDLRAAADVVKGRKLAGNISLAMVVPGSGLIKKQAEDEGLDEIFISAGFEWREPGCSMCLAMNADRLEPGERCAATSNRNFEGRQGRGGRTHLVSPETAAAAAIAGRLVDIRSLR